MVMMMIVMVYVLERDRATLQGREAIVAAHRGRDDRVIELVVEHTANHLVARHVQHAHE